MQLSSTLTRAAVCAGSLALLLSGAPAQADSGTDAAAGLYRELAAGGHHLSQTFGTDQYPDYGLTLDAVLALGATKRGQTEAAAATTYVADNLGSYIGSGTEAYAGATAKALLIARAQNNSNSLAGTNLVTRLKGLENGKGRFADKSAYGDYSNTFGQAIALIALSKAGASRTARSRDYLYAQQCPGGGFRIAMADAKCAAAGEADTDATSMALLAMTTLKATRARKTRIANAAKYLRAQMGADGGVKGGSPTNTANANSTGLASLAFRVTSRGGSADLANSYLRSLQFGCAFPASIRGLIAYDKAAFTAKQAEGAAAKATDQDRRATVQATLGLAGVHPKSITKTGATAGAAYPAC